MFCLRYENVLLPLPLPLGKESPTGINQEKELVLGLLAVASVQVMFQGYRPSQRADHIDFLPLDPPEIGEKVVFLCSSSKKPLYS